MAVAVRGVGDYPISSAGAHTDIAPTLPTGTTVGDHLFCVVTGGSTTGSGLPVWSITGGWNDAGQLSQVDPFVGTSTNVIQLFWKVAGASESAPTISYVSGSEDYRCARISGFSGAPPLNDAVTTGTTSGSSYTPATLSVPLDGMGIVVAAPRSGVFDAANGTTANGWQPTHSYTSKWGDPQIPAAAVIYKAGAGGDLTMPVLLGQFTTTWMHYSCVLGGGLYPQVRFI